MNLISLIDFLFKKTNCMAKTNVFAQKHPQRVLPHDTTNKTLRLSAVSSQDEKEETHSFTAEMIFLKGEKNQKYG